MICVLVYRILLASIPFCWLTGTYKGKILRVKGPIKMLNRVVII